MDKLNKILTVIDPTLERDPIIARAKLLSKASGAEVDFFINSNNSLNEHSYIYAGVDADFFAVQRKLWTAHYQNQLKELQEEFAKEGLSCKTTFNEHHHLGEAIINHVRESKPDLVLKSTHHHSLLERSVITNTDWRLIRKCPAPLWLAKPDTWNGEASLVTAVDPLHPKSAQATLDHLLIATTQFLAKLLTQKACVFHSYFPFVSSMFPPETDTSEHLARIRREHEEKLDELLEKHNIDKSNSHLTHGDLVPSLVNYLKSEDANLLVIGALSRNFLERAIVGNTAEKILEDCPCDVLVLKPPRK